MLYILSWKTHIRLHVGTGSSATGGAEAAVIGCSESDGQGEAVCWTRYDLNN